MKQCNVSVNRNASARSEGYEGPYEGLCVCLLASDVKGHEIHRPSSFNRTSSISFFINPWSFWGSQSRFPSGNH